MTHLNLLSSLLDLEHSIFYATPSPVGVSPFVHQSGSRPILISAPHSAVHTRNGRLKRADGFTGAIASLLAEKTNAHALYVNYRLNGDPNWDVHSPYKSLLSRIVREHDIQFVLDLHGMSNWHKIGVALGTINGRSCPSKMPLIEQTFINHGFKKVLESEAKSFSKLQWQTYVTNHSRFTGGVSSHTITRYLTEKVGIGCIQIELCSTVRVVSEDIPTGSPKRFRGNPEAISTIINALTGLICNIM